MSLTLRITLVIVALFSAAVVLYSIRKSKMRIEDSIFWAGLSFLVLLLSIFPQIGLGLSGAREFCFLVFHLCASF